MKKCVICLLLAATVICSTSICAFATHYTDPHVKLPDTKELFMHNNNPN